MEIIKFSENWNNGKLNLNAFSTIRLAQDKYLLHEDYEIVYAPNRKSFEPLTLGIAEIVNITKFKLKHLTQGMALLDTGYEKSQVENIIKTMYWKIEDWENQYLIFMILQYKERFAYAPIKQLITNEKV